MQEAGGVVPADVRRQVKRNVLLDSLVIATGVVVLLLWPSCSVAGFLAILGMTTLSSVIKDI